MQLRPFHLAIPVHDLETCLEFYLRLFNVKTGRTSDHWVDLDFFGHQLVLHLDENHQSKRIENQVDGHQIPVPHFGIVLDWNIWDELKIHIESTGHEFVVPPHHRFAGKKGDQRTMFLTDPAGNFIELKCFKNESELFEEF